MTENLNQAPIIIDGVGNNDFNRGDQAIRITVCKLLDTFLPQFPRLYSSFYKREDVEFNGPCPDPKAVYPSVYEIPRKMQALWCARADLTRVFNYYPGRKIRKYMKNATAYVLTAGDILVMDYTPMGLRINSAPCYWATREGIPNIVWGASIGPFPSGTALERRMAKLYGSMDLLLVRESQTFNYLQSLGVTENVMHVCDSAFNLPVVPLKVEGRDELAPGERFIPRALDDALNAGAVGLDLSPYRTQQKTMSDEQWFRQNLDALTNVVRKVDRPIILIPHVHMPNWIFQGNNDFVFQTRLYNELPDDLRKQVILYDSREHTCMEIKWVISRLQMIGSMRTHACIAGYSTCTPTFAITYSRKSIGIYEDLFGAGDRKWIESFKNVSGDLANVVNDMLARRTEIVERLQSVIPGYQRLAYQGGERVAELLRARGKLD